MEQSENRNRISVRIAKGMSGRRFAGFVADFKRWGMRFDPQAKSWSMGAADSMVAQRLRGFIGNGDLEVAI